METNQNQGCTTCKNKGQEKKKCDKCEKAKKGLTPYAVLSGVVFIFLVYGIYNAVVDIIGLFSN